MSQTNQMTDIAEHLIDKVSLHSVEIGNESFYKIENSNLMRPFMMNVVSDSNHWMFLMSNGGITAGRKNAEYALFPYYTDDKLGELAELIGSKSIFQITSENNTHVWEPFSDRYTGKYYISRNLYKNKSGNKVIFEEINHDLQVVFNYEWNSSKIFGFVKKCFLKNLSDKNYTIVLLDGLQNIMPHGVGSSLQNSTSNLVDAYKRNELDRTSGLGIFSLSAFIVDKAEPSESLKANIVWSNGLKPDLHLLSSLQIDAFRNQKKIKAECDIKGEKGSYFVQSTIDLIANDSLNWELIANVNLDHAAISSLILLIVESNDISIQLQNDVDHGTENLVADIAAADGMQYTADSQKDARHFSNVLFNIMRGGIFDNNYMIAKKDYGQYLQNANQHLCNAHKEFFQSLPEEFGKIELEEKLNAIGNPDLIRLTKEYLPLRFSRRHGDPSRPWNKFTINTHNEINGSKILDYEGNWRDIFQNWEALAHSYPEFVEGMIFKFLNASTFDGYNPYRVTKAGFDWETIEPDNPWSYIGYWGDHQIIYLLKFLEFAQQKDDKLLASLFDKEYFVYANVPYRIKPYSELLKDAKNTIEFDEEGDRSIRKKIEQLGSDGALLGSRNAEIYKVNFIEKILASVLSKTSNFIPEAGIWMNTQRPEWNDANNALVGNGISMVTLCYLRRFLNFMNDLLAENSNKQIPVSTELFHFFEEVLNTLKSNEVHLSNGFDNFQRKKMADALGLAGSDYREKIYVHGFSGQKSNIEFGKIQQYTKLANTYFDQAIKINVRPNKLYNAYNLLTLYNDRFEIGHLSEMLEGQVAAISSGLLEVEEVVVLLDSLRHSSLYREEQNSYLLYPNKELPGFLEKNAIPSGAALKSTLLRTLADDGDRSVIVKDVNGNYHFNGNFHNAEDLKHALDDLRTTHYSALVEKEQKLVLEIFEQVFNHKSFTGRSGTFFAYEGLGSIYWHMVSKLYLAVEEVCSQAIQKNTPVLTLNKLLSQFSEIGEGIGVHKSPMHYGAFPTDAYSHTPMHRGAQQPGMTGQVKEDILVRLAELGIRIQNGQISFVPAMLKKGDFVAAPITSEFIDINGTKNGIRLDTGMLAFSYCQIPVVYELSNKEELIIEYNDQSRETQDNLILSKKVSIEIFGRTGKVVRIHAMIQEKSLSA